MPVGPYSQDVLTRIVNVQWGGGGVFVAGDLNSGIFYLKLGVEAETDEGPAWENLGQLDFEQGNVGRVLGSAFASIADNRGNKNPVFVLVGGGGSTTSIGIIMASRDGKNWSRVFSYGAGGGDTYLGATILGVVWDEAAKLFYAGGHQSDSFSDFEAGYAWMSETDLLFQSSDGYSWSEIGRNERRVEAHGGAAFPPLPEYDTGLLSAHCSDRVKDINDSNVPGGVYGYDEDKNFLIKPAELQVVDYSTGGVGGYGSAGITVSNPDPEAVIPSATIPTTCVATVGGRWVIAGGSFGSPPQAAVLTSSEDGPIWKRTDPPGTDLIVTMTAGVVSAANARL
jgi:hypothetical protein